MATPHGPAAHVRSMRDDSFLRPRCTGEPDPEAAPESSRGRRARARAGHPRRRRPDPGRGRDRHDGRDAVRAARRRRRRRPAGGHVRRPQRAADRRQEHAGPPLPVVLLRTLRPLVLPAGPRHLPLHPPRAVRPAGPAAGRRRLAHHHLRRARHVRHRRRRAGGRGRDGRLRLRAALPTGDRRRAHRPAAGRESRRRTSSWSCCAATAYAAAAAPSSSSPATASPDCPPRPGRTICNMAMETGATTAALPRRRGDSRLARGAGPGARLPPAERRPRGGLRRAGSDRPVRSGAARRAPAVAGQRRPGRRGGRNRGGAGLRRVVGEQRLRGPRHRRRRPRAGAPCTAASS